MFIVSIIRRKTSALTNSARINGSSLMPRPRRDALPTHKRWFWINALTSERTDSSQFSTGIYTHSPVTPAFSHRISTAYPARRGSSLVLKILIVSLPPEGQNPIPIPCRGSGNLASALCLKLSTSSYMSLWSLVPWPGPFPATKVRVPGTVPTKVCPFIHQ